MAMTWKRVESLNKPIEFEQNSANGVYIRKNIECVNRIDENGNEYAVFCYDEAYLTQSEYVVYQISQKIVEDVALKHENDIIDDYTLKLFEEGIL